MDALLFNQLLTLIAVVTILLIIGVAVYRVVTGQLYGIVSGRQSVRPWFIPDVRSFLSVFLVVSVVLLIFVMVFHPLKDADDITKAAIGALLSVGFATIVNFWFSSSKGSADKDDTINRMAVDQPPAAPPKADPPAG